MKLSTTLIVTAALGIGSSAWAETSAVLFQVDMSVQEDIGNFNSATDPVYVRGGLAPLDWETGLQLTESVINEDVYEVVVDFDDADAGTTVEFKYVYIAGGDNWETRNNRSFLFEGEDLILDTVFFDDFYGYTDQDVTVTFNVLQNDDCLSCTIDQMAIRGAAAPLNWDDDTQTLTDNGDDTWSISLLFPAGTTPRGTIAYKYRAHADMKPERFDILGDPCTAWDDLTNWMWQDLRNPYPGDCLANLTFEMDDTNPTLELDLDDWYPPAVGVEDRGLDAPAAPAAVVLAQNTPNPFNPSTAIHFELAEAGSIELAVYDLAGRKVATLAEGDHSAGRHTVGWRPAGLASGVYVYSLVAGENRVERSMLLLK